MVASLTPISSAMKPVDYFTKDGYYAKGDLEHKEKSYRYGQAAEDIGRDFIPGDDFDRFEAINHLKQIGTKLPHKAGKPKWTNALIRHMEMLICTTQERDWTDRKPIVWLSVEGTAHRLGIGRNQVNHNEKMLFQLGALTWTDSGNYKRFGKRDERGRIITAYGVILHPLLYI